MANCLVLSISQVCHELMKLSREVILHTYKTCKGKDWYYYNTTQRILSGQFVLSKKVGAYISCIALKRLSTKFPFAVPICRTL